MKKRKSAVPLFAVLAIISIFGAAFVAAYGGWRESANLENKETIRAALLDNDYFGWKNAIESELTQERFNQIRARHIEMQEKRTAIEKAFEAKDFEAWKKAVSADGRSVRMLEIVNEKNFARFAEMHLAMKSGDFEKAKEIRSELGLPEKGKGCGFGGKDFGKGMFSDR